MSQFETSSTVSSQGEIHLVGVPFTPGTEVEVVISSKSDTPDGSNHLSSLFAALDSARNTQPIGQLRREDFYDRNCIR